MHQTMIMVHMIIAVALICAAHAATMCENKNAFIQPCIDAETAAISAWDETNNKCAANADKATCEGGAGTCGFVDNKCKAKNTSYCLALATKAKCLLGINCYPKINSDQFPKIRDVDQQAECEKRAKDKGCAETTCDSGSHLVPSLVWALLVSVMAAVAQM